MKGQRRLRRLRPDAELIRRRAAGETLRELAPVYGVRPSTLCRYFKRPQVVEELKAARQRERCERRAAEAHRRAEAKAEQEAARKARRQTQADERGSGEEPPLASTASDGDQVLEDVRRRPGPAASSHSPSLPPLELAPFSDDWRAWYDARRLRSQNDWLNHNDAVHGIIPPRERRARQRQPSGQD